MAFWRSAKEILLDKNFTFLKALCGVSRCKVSVATGGSAEGTEGQPSKRRLKDAENIHSTNHSLGLLKRHVSIDTKKAYKPPADVSERVQNISESLLAGGISSDWQSTSLGDAKVKYKLLTTLIHEFNHNVPNSVLSDMNTVGDVVRFFQTEVRTTSSYEDLASRHDLPPNLSIQQEYVRFNPESDTMFGGRTAFPGSDTVVTSIKYRRKYPDIKTTKEKPGYVNYYYDY